VAGGTGFADIFYVVCRLVLRFIHRDWKRGWKRFPYASIHASPMKELRLMYLEFPLVKIKTFYSECCYRSSSVLKIINRKLIL
jgi:hypothetical protein